MKGNMIIRMMMKIYLEHCMRLPPTSHDPSLILRTPLTTLRICVCLLPLAGQCPSTAPITTETHHPPQQLLHYCHCPPPHAPPGEHLLSVLVSVLPPPSPANILTSQNNPPITSTHPAAPPGPETHAASLSLPYMMLMIDTARIYNNQAMHW